ncbi:hypothetical protein DNTS_035535 [Danionella cerebrum]|uniref:Mimecan n=1 Tax=Danionella cerebrum TaxID=2873325 RepID=A0A553QVE9_9TELE|nr:hypothetical protein DNTS_035535 [Danionella translucida]
MTVFLKLLLFVMAVPWIFSEKVKINKVVPRQKELPKVFGDGGLNSGKEPTKEKKENVILSPDYDSPVDADAYTPAVDLDVDKGFPTCLMCVCLSGSVYCEEVSPDMTTVPMLPKETGYLYARFNKITKITSKDFENHGVLKRIDLSGNLISEIEDGAFSKLHQLEELSLAENKLLKLPFLPTSLVSLNANHNLIRTKGVKISNFKKLTKLAYLYLGDNRLEVVPPLPESLRVVHLHNNNITSLTDDTFCRGNGTRYIRYNMQEVRMDGNPITLAQHPNSFTCLKSLPIGHYK